MQPQASQLYRNAHTLAPRFSERAASSRSPELYQSAGSYSHVPKMAIRCWTWQINAPSHAANQCDLSPPTPSESLIPAFRIPPPVREWRYGMQCYVIDRSRRSAARSYCAMLHATHEIGSTCDGRGGDLNQCTCIPCRPHGNPGGSILYLSNA